MSLELAHVKWDVHVGVEEGALYVKLVQDQVEHRRQREDYPNRTKSNRSTEHLIVVNPLLLTPPNNNPSCLPRQTGRDGRGVNNSSP